MTKCQVCLLFDEEQRTRKNMGCKHPNAKTLLCPLEIKHRFTHKNSYIKYFNKEMSPLHFPSYEAMNDNR